VTTKPLPDPDVQLVDGQGRPTRDFYDYLISRDRMKVADLRDISTTAPTNGQVLIWNNATKLWTPGVN
jgi:hypothetical protein